MIGFLKKLFYSGLGKVEVKFKGKSLGDFELSNGHRLYGYNPYMRVLERVSKQNHSDGREKSGWIYIYALNVRNADKKITKMGYTVDVWQ